MVRRVRHANYPLALALGMVALPVLAAACGARSNLLEGDADLGGGGAAATTTTSSSSSSSATTTTTSSSSSSSGGAGGSACTPEVCDGVDNDCDGAVDEDCGCTPGEQKTCYSGPPSTLDVGVCSAGTQECLADGQFGPCQGEVTPSPDVCDGIDRDCDGKVATLCGTGCSDGAREGFLDEAVYPKIAACAGGFSLPGALTTLVPACGRLGGDDGANPNGEGCNMADLCALGFHVCTGADDVAQSSPTGCVGAATGPGLFFVARQSGPGCGICSLGGNSDPAVCNGCSCGQDCAQTTLTANDVFGCGTQGLPISTCGVLDRFSNDACVALGPAWSCQQGCNEANTVTKSSSADGGVLCCAD